MGKQKRIIYPVVFMFLITFILTLALAFINHATYDKILSAQEIELKRKLLYSFNIEFKEENIDQVFDSSIELKEIKKDILYVYKDTSGEVLSYGKLETGPGLWGSVTIFIALDKSTENLVGLNIISHSETPGLGGRIEENWFKDQFRGIVLNSSNPFIEYKPSDKGNVDGISGATLTSESVKKIINKSIEDIRSLLEVN